MLAYKRTHLRLFHFQKLLSAQEFHLFLNLRFHSGKSFLIRTDQDHPFKQWKFHNRIVDPSSAGKQTSECRRLHIRVIVKYKKRERLRYLFQPDSCHIVIVSGINKMDSSGRIRGNTAANGIYRILITVAVGSGNVPGLHPGYFFSPPELLILIYSGKIHHQYLYIFICIFHVHILPRNGR